VHPDGLVLHRLTPRTRLRVGPRGQAGEKDRPLGHQVHDDLPRLVLNEAALEGAAQIGASGGFASSDISKWLVWPSRFWSVGPSVSETVYDGGLRRSRTVQARAAYDESVASYRQSVLTAFREVEDNLAALRILEDEARVQRDAVQAAEESVRLTTDRYKAGTVSYLDVVVAQTAALTDARAAVDITARRLSASVLLIEALGGGWDGSALPSAGDVAAAAHRPPVGRRRVRARDGAGTAGHARGLPDGAAQAEPRMTPTPVRVAIVGANEGLQRKMRTTVWNKPTASWGHRSSSFA
jgi:hypothetical protein